MVKKSGEYSQDITLGTDTWNVADGYTKLKILRQLILLDRWETIAQFGTEEIDEEIKFENNYIVKRRIEALQRFHSTLKQLLGNTFFAIKKTDKPLIEEYVKRLNQLNEFLATCYEEKQDQISKENILEINEKQFKYILEILQEVKEKINIPLNHAGLIFRPTEEVDLDKIMNDIIEGG